ncbi:ABC transporter permease [Saccharomonospora halophila]|uniref:ABC transporter permease n=1 Tax=Saccharomonospora halophila TaxID=129922 RepID=UPI0003629D9F|nr:ABC transporter permease [Saccharomonospora halophila]
MTSTDTRTPTASAPATGPGTGTSFWSATRLVAEREIRSFLRMKSWWIGFATLVVGLFATALLPSLFGDGGDDGDDGRPGVAVVGIDPPPGLEAAADDIRILEVDDPAGAGHLLADGEVRAIVTPDDTDGSDPDGSDPGVHVLAASEPPLVILDALGSLPPVEIIESPDDAGEGERALVTIVFGLLFLMFGMGGIAIAQSTVTEKQTRIVEILVSTVPVRALLAGKIAGHSLLTIGQVLALAVLAPVALRLGGHTDLLSVLAPAVGWFVPFMLLGFVLLAAMWAVAGSVVSRQEDLGSSTSLVMLFVMLPYFAVVFFGDNAGVLAVLSYVPFSAPVGMPVRLFTGDAQVWEALVSLGVLVAALVVIVLLASRVYSGALLQTRGRIGLAQAWGRADDRPSGDRA